MVEVDQMMKTPPQFRHFNIYCFDLDRGVIEMFCRSFFFYLSYSFLNPLNDNKSALKTRTVFH